jgi:(R,R)-butanediol dehydrogenase / meso-butanediol dehydrogenase / diacetyl reductase
MKALVFHGTKDVRLEDIKEPAVPAGKVKVKVAWIGICGTDIHIYQHGIAVPMEPHPVTGRMAPLTIGHEFAGVVSEVGKGVKGIHAGDRVTVEPTITCGHCELCRTGKYNLCLNTAFLGASDDGGYAEYVIVEPYMVHKLPDNVSLEEGALVEPTAVAMQAVINSSLKMGDTIAVYGVGPIGLLTILCAKAAGAAKIIAIDVSKVRLEKACEVGATHIINATDEDPVAKINADFGSVDVVYEVAGAQATLTSAIKSVKKGGEVMVISIFAAPVEIDMADLLTREVRISTSCIYRHVFPKVIGMVSSRQLDVMKVVTGKIKLDDIITDGFERLMADKGQAKILVEIQP